MKSWDERKKVGAPKKLSSPEHLWGLCCDYCKEVDNYPFKKKDFIKGGERAGEIVDIETQRPYTWSGFEDYLFKSDVIVRLDDYKSNKDKSYTEFSDIITRIGNLFYSQKFEGAAVGAFNANIISKDLGLIEKTRTEIVEQPLFGDE